MATLDDRIILSKEEQNEPITSALDFWIAAAEDRSSLCARTASESKRYSSDKTWENLELEIGALDRAKVLLRSKQNALRSACTLTPEILSSIFRECAYSEPDGSGSITSKSHELDIPESSEPNHFQSRRLGWIKVSHVCASWRQSACADQGLWARITDGLGLQWIDLKLSRAPSAPLSISVTSWRSFGGALVPHLKKHLHHTRELNLRLAVGDITDDLRSALLAHAPCLTALSIDSFGTLRFSNVLPCIVFRDQFPALRILILRGSATFHAADFECTPPRELEEIQITTSDRFSVSQLSSLLLASSTSLRKLSFNAPLCLPLSELTTRQDSIFLPRLEYLSIKESLSQYIAVLGALHLQSPMRCLRLSTTDFEEDLLSFPVTWPAISHALSLLYRDPHIISLKNLKIELDSVSEVSWIFLSGSQGSAVPPDLHIEFVLDGSDVDQKREIFTALPLQTVESFSLDASNAIKDDLDEWLWHSTAVALSAVLSISVCIFVEDSNSWDGFFQALTPHTSSLDCNFPISPLHAFPALTRLTIILKSWVDNDDPSNPTGIQVWIDRLLAALSERRSYGIGIQDLFLTIHTDWELDNAIKERLEKIVPNIQVIILPQE